MSDRSINEVYYETVRPPVFFQYFLYAVVGLLVYLTFTDISEMSPIIGVFGILVVYIVSSIFGQLSIRITKSVITVGFGFIKHTIALDNIEYIEVKRFPWWKYGGFGVRFGLDWSVGYITNYKPGILVAPKRGRKLFFSTNNADELVEKLDNQIVKHNEIIR